MVRSDPAGPGAPLGLAALLVAQGSAQENLPRSRVPGTLPVLLYT